jgi:phasin family protein
MAVTKKSSGAITRPSAKTSKVAAASRAVKADSVSSANFVEPEALAAPVAAKAPKAKSIGTVAADKEGMKMVDVIETTKKFADQAKEKLTTAYAEISEKTKDGFEKSTKAVSELTDITKGNVEAIVESGKIAAKGVETLGQEAAEYGRTSFEKASATMKSFASVKTPAEFFQLQSELMTSSFDAFAKEAAKSSEALLKLAGDVAQPISTRVAIVTDKVKSLAA